MFASNVNINLWQCYATFKTFGNFLEPLATFGKVMKILATFSGSLWHSEAVSGSQWQTMAVSGSLSFSQLITRNSLSAAGAKADCALPTIPS